MYNIGNCRVLQINMDTDIKKIIHAFLAECSLMQLATAKDNQPWVCNVWFAADENMHIYWISADHRRHSQEILQNSKIAATIVRPYSSQEIPSGLQLQGKAEILTDKKEIKNVRALFKKKQFNIDRIMRSMKEENKSFHFYKLNPTIFAIFDTVYFPTKARYIFERKEKN